MKTTALCIGILGAALASASAEEPMKTADGYPDRPITVIVPWGAGGGSDTVARAWGNAMGEVLGQPLQVVNKPGGGGLAGVPDFMAAPKDGYTLFQTVDNAVSDHVAERLRENPATDWEPLCATQITFSQLYIRPDDARFSDFEDVLAYAKENPGALTVANTGNPGTMDRLLVTFLEQALDFDTRAIAFDKPAERYASIIGGTVDLMLEQPGDVRAYVDAGQIKPILTFFDERPAMFADVPTHREAGAEFDPLLRFRGFWVHPDVPQERKDLLETACRAAFDSEEYRAFNKKGFMDLVDSYRGSADFRTMIENEIELYTEAFKAAGL